VQLLLESEEPLALLDGELRYGNPGRARDDVGDVLDGDLGCALPFSPLARFAPSAAGS
jgi:hypothetical protein